MCVAVINSPNNGQAGPPLHQACDSVSGGWEFDLISINCERPAGKLGPHMVFGRCVPEGLERGLFRDSQVHTLTVK